MARPRSARRDFLKTPLALVALGAAPSLRAQQAPGGRLKDFLPELVGLPAAFTLDERNRRWARVRAMMRRDGFDCLLAPAADGEGQADSRYLAQQAGWVVFPIDGPVTAIGESGAAGARWADRVVPAADGSWSPRIIDALRELKLQTSRVGVARLDNVLRNAEGDVTFTTLERVRRAFPSARFDSAADQMMRVKLVRSQEEIDVMIKATEASERGLEAMIRAARPGVLQKDVWIAVFDAMTSATGETPSRLALRAGDEANTSGGAPLLERIGAGQIMNQEIAARVLGYMAQVNHSICVGRPAPADWPAAARYCIDLFHELVDWIEPGKRFMDLCRLYADKAKTRSPELVARVLVHTCGLGDGPRMGATRSETPDLVIEPAMVFTIKPRVVIKGTQPTAQFGDPVLVTERGARRLGRRTLEPINT
jgi:Xaa-Pro aminopeptidase